MLTRSYLFLYSSGKATPWGPQFGLVGIALGFALGVILGNWFMLFRAHLFNDLESGSRRRRIYQAKG